MGFDGKKDFKSDFKEVERSEQALSLKESRVKENSRQHGRPIGLHNRAYKAETAHGRQAVEAWLCLDAWSLVPECTAVPLRTLAYNLLLFLFKRDFFHSLGGFFWQHFREIIRVLA